MTAEATDAGSTVKRSTPDTTYDLTHKGTERIHVVDTTIKTDANFESTHKGIGGKTGDIVGTTTTQTGSTEVNNSNPSNNSIISTFMYRHII